MFYREILKMKNWKYASKIFFFFFFLYGLLEKGSLKNIIYAKISSNKHFNMFYVQHR